MLGAADMVVLGVLLLSGVLGLWRGFVTEVMSLASWVLAFWATFAFGDGAAAMLEGWIDAEAARGAAGYVGVFLAVLAAGGILTWLFGRLVRATGLSGTDRLLGFGFGLLRGAALCVVGILLLGFTPLPQRAEWGGSALIAVLQPGAEWLAAWLPEPVAAQIRFPASAAPSLQEPPHL